ncbi:MAG TPA: hypothetical protein VMY43_06275 [Methanothrix sp.]|nr:hypothetical protein [Methanothrix sp.]
MTDRGTQFYANKRDKNGNAKSRFENFLEKSETAAAHPRRKRRGVT